MPLRLRAVGRLGCLVAVVVGGVRAAWWVSAGATGELVGVASSPGAVQSWSLDRLVVDVASVALLVAATGWAVVSLLAAVAAVVADRAPALVGVCARTTPRSYRRLVAASLGLGLSVPLISGGAGLAADHGQRCGCPIECRPAGTHSALSGLGFPDLPSTPAVGGPARTPELPIVVRDGDSLWRITEHALGRRASTADVATATWRLYAANMSTIGDDPDLIHPGMWLINPEGSS